MSNDSLISRLANARAIASERLPAADVAAIDDAIASLTTQPQAEPADTTFRKLKVGEKFKFFQGGSLLTKSSERSYDAPQWGQHDNPATDLDQAVIPAPTEPTEPT